MERALEHIRAAKALSHELGGTDVDVKKYFFALPAKQMAVLLHEYGRLHGSSAQQYAAKTLPSWKNGSVYMSGLVAERLFALLPPRMPISDKYRLTQNLWEHYGPKSKKRLRIGIESDVESVVSVVRIYFDDVVSDHNIPDQMERRFNWLSAGDVQIKQQLLNHLRSQERTLLSEGVKLQLPVLIEHLRADTSSLTSRVSQTLKIGKHELEILVDPNAEGFKFEDWTPLASARSSATAASSVSAFFGNGLVIWLMVIGGLMLLSKCSYS